MELIDLSSNNGQVNFPAVRGSGISGVFVKVTEGLTYPSQNDPYWNTWKNYVLGARRAGLQVGIYHFARPDLGNSPQAEADHFYTVGKQLMPYDLPWVLDIEKGDHIGGWSEAFLVRLHSLCGTLPAIYLSPGWWESAGADATAHIGSYPLWVASYGVSKPMVPAPWTDWTWWQYTDSGTVKGISGNVDLNHGKEDDVTPAQEAKIDKLQASIDALTNRLNDIQTHIAARFDQVDKEITAKP